MYRKIIVPTKKNHTISLPEEFYGCRIEVLAFPIDEKNPVSEQNTIIDNFYEGIRLDFSKFKFNREEANER